MNSTELRGTWDQVKGFSKELWGELVGNEHAFYAGFRQRLIGKLEARYGLSRDEAEHQVHESDPHD
ncbi:MAG: CsbD family protein [Desulfuromonadales bacterium]|jgi:uncharacterized protein YjbJ (UPF0337 family)|nr:CsbD family protein [Desulfuromonadales bacterium]